MVNVTLLPMRSRTGRRTVPRIVEMIRQSALAVMISVRCGICSTNRSRLGKTVNSHPESPIGHVEAELVRTEPARESTNMNVVLISTVSVLEVTDEVVCSLFCDPDVSLLSLSVKTGNGTRCSVTINFR